MDKLQSEKLTQSFISARLMSFIKTKVNTAKNASLDSDSNSLSFPKSKTFIAASNLESLIQHKSILLYIEHLQNPSNTLLVFVYSKFLFNS